MSATQVRGERPAGRGRAAWLVGLLGIFLLVAGSGGYQAVTAPTFSSTDEQAHVGYVLALLDGHLPEIDEAIDAKAGGPELEARLDWQPDRRRDVWVANNPPLPYLLALGPAALTRSLDVPGGPLMGLRVVDVAFLAAAAVVVARLGRDLAGGDRRVGLVAGGLFAAAPHVGLVAGTGSIDGFAVLCSVAILHALVGVCRRGPSRGDVVRLAVWCALGGGTRPMTAVLGGFAGAVAVGVAAWRRRHPAAAADPPSRRFDHLDDDSVFVYDQDLDVHGVEDDAGGGASPDEPVPAGRPALGPLAVALAVGLPVLLLDGWWYVRNVSLYGDATGSQRLLDKFLRTSPGTVVDAFAQKSIWREALRTLFLRRLEVALPRDPTAWTPLVVGLALVAVAGTAVLVARDRRAAEPRTSALAWAAMTGACAVVVLMVAQHWSGGGAPHPRYFLPALAVLTSAAALVAVRTAGAWLGALLVGALCWVQLVQAPRALRELLRNDVDPLPDQLNRSIGPAWLAGAAGWTAAVGAVVLLVALALVRPEAEPTEAEGTGPPAPPPGSDPGSRR